MPTDQLENLYTINADWNEFPENSISRESLEEIVLPAYLKKCRWFGGKARSLSIRIHTHVRISHDENTSYLLLIHVKYENGEAELYQLAISFLAEEDITGIDPVGQLCFLNQGDSKGRVIDAVHHESFRKFLFHSIHHQRNLQDGDNLLQFHSGSAFKEFSSSEHISSRILGVEQSNTSIIYDDLYILKLFRRVEFATNPDLEMTRFLNNQTSFKNIPALEGIIQLIHQGSATTVIGLMQELVANEGDSWKLFQKILGDYYAKILSGKHEIETPPEVNDIAHYTHQEMKDFLDQFIGTDVFTKVELLAKRTAEMHIALASHRSSSVFGPDPVDEKYRKGLYKSLKKLVKTRLTLLGEKRAELSGNVRADSQMVIEMERKLLKFFKKRLNKGAKVARIRIHGDFHLGQVLFTGKDFIILDFEGEPEKSYKERRQKQMALKDVAGMIRSFHYAVHAAILQNYEDPKVMAQLTPWAELWYHAVSRCYFEAYLETAKGQIFIPKKKNLIPFLQLYLMEKSIYELGYEINNRPDWVMIPIWGIKHFITNYIIEKAKVT